MPIEEYNPLDYANLTKNCVRMAAPVAALALIVRATLAKVAP